MPNGDHGDQRRLAAAGQLVSIGDEVGMVQADTATELDDGAAQFDRAFAADAGAWPGSAGGFVVASCPCRCLPRHVRRATSVQVRGVPTMASVPGCPRRCRVVSGGSGEVWAEVGASKSLESHHLPTW